ncbi:basic salivary proline-rich protein 2-like [Aquila chrysaetos chrysaetos]|uniref:basic salivary proline-rich protein 2-like n=1 Tax=Aquila chrysaetos chrysaetos TaxID=223781 RepID=UPI0011767E2C|nr:basic salivary proline-rich protein 2-like [Aquila chrysaetos chrysaetos]
MRVRPEEAAAVLLHEGASRLSLCCVCGSPSSALLRFVHVLLELLRSGPAVQSPPSPPSSSSFRLPPLFVAPYLADDPAPPPTPGSSAALPGDFFSPLRLATVPPLTPRPASSGWIFPSWQEAEVGRGVASARGFRPYNYIGNLRDREGVYSLAGRPWPPPPLSPPAPSAPSGPVPSRRARALRAPPAGRSAAEGARSGGERPERGPSASPGHPRPSPEQQQQRTPRGGGCPRGGGTERVSPLLPPSAPRV